jgi:hypothetical protein
MASCLCTKVRVDGSKTALGDFGSTGPGGERAAGCRNDLDSTAVPEGFARILPLDNREPSTLREIWWVLTGRCAAFWTDCSTLRTCALATPDDVAGRVVEAILWTASWLTTGPPNQPDLAADAGDIGREKFTDDL